MYFKNTCCISCFFLAVITLILYIIFSVDYTLKPMLLENNCTCSNTNFISIAYKYNNDIRCICYMLLLEKNTLENTKTECKKNNSDLWSIKDGENEFTQIFLSLPVNKTEIWLDGLNYGVNIFNKSLKHVASNGNGSNIAWNYPYYEKYSRLYTITTIAKMCIYVEPFINNELSLWNSADCDDKHYGVCIIR